MSDQGSIATERNAKSGTFEVASSLPRLDFENAGTLTDDEFSELLRTAERTGDRGEPDASNCTPDDYAQAQIVFQWLEEAIRLDELLLRRSQMLAAGQIKDTSLLNDIILDMLNQGKVSFLGCQALYFQIDAKITEAKVRQQVIKGEFHLNMVAFGKIIAAKANTLQTIFDQLLRLRIKYDLEEPGSSETAAKILQKHREFQSAYEEIGGYGLYDVEIYNQSYEFFKFGEGLSNLKERADNLAKLPVEKFLDRYAALELPLPQPGAFLIDPEPMFAISGDWGAVIVVPEVQTALKSIRGAWDDERRPPSPLRIFVDPDTILGAEKGVYETIQHAYGTAVEFIVFGELDPTDPISDLFPDESDWKRARDIIARYGPTYIAPMTSPQRIYADWRSFALLQDADSELKLLSESEVANNAI